MLSISRESEGYDKGKTVMNDIVVTMGMLCAPRLSLKPLIHDSRSYVDVLLFHMRTPSSAVCLLCQLVGVYLRKLIRVIAFTADISKSLFLEEITSPCWQQFPLRKQA